MAIQPNKKAELIASAASEKKAKDITIIDMRKIPNIADYFVVTSGSSTTQVRAIADNVIFRMRERGERLYHSEGMGEALWILLDFWIRGDARIL